MKFSFGIIVAAAIAIGFAPMTVEAQPVGVNIVTDPNFTGTLGSDGWAVYQDGCVSNCETVAYGTSADLTSAPFTNITGPLLTANAPLSFAAFQNNAGNTGAYLEQVFNTVVGTNYVLTYQYVPLGNNNANFTLLTQIVYLTTPSDVLVAQSTINGVTSPDAGVVETVTLSFLGNGNPFALIIGDFSPAGSVQDLLVTNVSVVNVPEPLSLALMGTALVGLGVARRGRRS